MQKNQGILPVKALSTEKETLIQVLWIILVVPFILIVRLQSVCIIATLNAMQIQWKLKETEALAVAEKQFAVLLSANKIKLWCPALRC